MTCHHCEFDDSIDMLNPPLFGCKYDFDLDGLITVPEFMVNKKLLIAIADKFDLDVVYRVVLLKYEI